MGKAILLFVNSTVGKIVIAGVVAFGLGVGVSVWATGIYYRSDIAGLKMEAANKEDANAKSALVQFEDATKKISLAAGNYAAIQASMTTNFDGILKDFRNVKFKAPLPVDCKPDPERLRVLTSAIAAANAYSTHGQ